MITNGIFINHSSFRAVDENSDVVLLSVPEAVVTATNEEFGTGTMTIPADSYSNQSADVSTVTLGALLVTNEAMDEETAYSLTSSLVNNIDEVRAVHSSMKALNPELLATASVLKFHPGAARAYQEAGLLN